MKKYRAFFFQRSYQKMIQLLIRLVKAFCAFGGPYVAPFIMPILGPICWITLVLCAFLPIYFSSNSFLNTDEKGNKTAGRSFTSAFFIHYTICVVLLCCIMQATCRVSRRVPMA